LSSIVRAVKKTSAALLLALASASSAYAKDNIALKTDRGAALLEVADRHLSATRELVMQALGYLGIRYKYGGNSPATGFDCSGLVRYVVNQAIGMVLPRDARAISQLGAQVGTDELQPGDLVFFNTMRRPFSHVGIYIGENRFIHAPASGGAVELVNMTERYWQARFDGARRLGQ
jgi:cell wall-associated NlpC family hydrolase